MPATDFDFLPGTWQVRNRKLTDALDPACDAWEEFASTWETRAMLGGGGNVDHIHAPGWEGLTLRLHDSGRDVWRIWWASTRLPGRLDPPVEGRFGPDGIGRFEGEDDLGGLPLGIRFAWSEIRDGHARWEQEFSFDGGATWKPNWVMELSR